MHDGDVRLLVQPSKSYRKGLCVTLVDPDGVPVPEDRSYLRPTVQTLLHQVGEEEKRLRGPFWNKRDDLTLGKVVQSVMENNELSGNGLFKDVYVGARTISNCRVDKVSSRISRIYGGLWPDEASIGLVCLVCIL
jgi:hypothetical protein